MAEKFENPNLIKNRGEAQEKKFKSAFDIEALPKIEKLLKPSKFPFPHWDLLADFPPPEILPEKRAAFKKKWQAIDITALDEENPQYKEYSADRRQLDEELQKFMKQKSPQEILQRAREVFRGHEQEGATAISVDGLIMGFHKAYRAAELFLIKSMMQEAAQSCILMLWHRIEEVNINDPRRTQLMRGIFGIQKWFPRVRADLHSHPESAGEMLAYLLVDGSLNDEDKEKLFNILVDTRKIKTKKVIMGHYPLRQAVMKQLRSLIKAGKKDEVIMATNFLEKKGVLDLNEDVKFFEEITEK